MGKLEDAIVSAKTVVAHRNAPASPCPDGTAAALLCHDALPRARIVFANHEELEAMEPEPNALFVDICPSRERASLWIEAGAAVLDHHAHQRDVVALFGELGVYADEPGVSGAVLAHRHVWHPILGPTEGGTRAREFAELAGIRDTWQKGSPGWTLACEQAEALRFWPWEVLASIEIPFSDGWRQLDDRLAIGEVLLARAAESARAIAARAHRAVTSAGTRLAILGTTHTSDAAEHLEADVVAGFAYHSDGERPKLVVSMRSRTGRDVGAIAKHHGGGGHRAAAGFTVDSPNLDPYAAVTLLVDSAEKGAGP